MITVCPSETIRAPVERVWRLLTAPANYDTWIGGRVERVDPPGAARVGQVVDVSAGAFGLRFKVRLRIIAVHEGENILEIDGWFPFGITLHERLSLAAVGDELTRVQFG